MIICDHREKRSGIPEMLIKEGIKDVRFAEMLAGDYKIVDGEQFSEAFVVPKIPSSQEKEQAEHYQEVLKNFEGKLGDLELYIKGVLVENKNAKDAITSTKTGHLSDQLWWQSKEYYSSVLIIEGSMYQAAKSLRFNFYNTIGIIDSAIMKRAAEGAHGNISVIITANRWETVQHLRLMHEYITGKKPIIREPSVVREVSKKDMNRNLIWTVASIPGVGKVRAQALLTHFKSIKNLFVAPLDQLETIPGIGPETAANIHSYYHEGYK